MRFYLSLLLVTLTPHVVSRVCVVPKAFLKLLRYVSARDLCLAGEKEPDTWELASGRHTRSLLGSKVV
jgi:hypothetical protein